jgi:hypothetical protein
VHRIARVDQDVFQQGSEVRVIFDEEDAPLRHCRSPTSND